MDTIQPRGLTFPEDLDETKINGLLQAILDGIDRDRLFQDARLTRVRHPLLKARIGKDTALDTEIHNLLTGIVTALSVSDEISNRAKLLNNMSRTEGILLDSARDPETLRANLAALKDAVAQLVVLNSEEDGAGVQGLVSGQLRQILTMPNAVQELVLYPAVTAASLGEPKDQILTTLEACRAALVAALEGREDNASRAFRDAVEAEAAAGRAWFEAATAHIDHTNVFHPDYSGTAVFFEASDDSPVFQLLRDQLGAERGCGSLDGKGRQWFCSARTSEGVQTLRAIIDSAAESGEIRILTEDEVSAIREKILRASNIG